MASTTTTVGLSSGGKAFFGSLCAGTFGLGCWQIQRLVEKLDKVEERTNELQMPPQTTTTTTTDWASSKQPYRRRLLEGTLRHDKEVLIGPRGAPAGVKLPRQGLSAKGQQQQSSGMAPGPQGYHVLTPLEIANSYPKRTVWINRGWVSKNMVAQGRNDIRTTTTTTTNSWSRPQGPVTLTTIRSSPEKPKIIAPEHDYSKRPLQLFWLDGLALQAIAETKEESILFTQVDDEEESKGGEEDYPLKPPVASVGDFKTTPAIHAGYAATWFGLSGAGIYMTRKLITRGRG